MAMGEQAVDKLTETMIDRVETRCWLEIVRYVDDQTVGTGDSSYRQTIHALRLSAEQAAKDQRKLRVKTREERLVECIRLLRPCVVYCRRRHKDPQTGTGGIPVETLVDETLKELGVKL